MSHARTTAKAPTIAHPKKKINKPHRCDGNGTINYICKHTYAYTERASSGTAVRGDSYVDKRLQDERGGMMSVAETGKGDQAAWTSEQDSHTFRLDKNICSHGQFYKRV